MGVSLKILVRILNASAHLTRILKPPQNHSDSYLKHYFFLPIINIFVFVSVVD